MNQRVRFTHMSWWDPHEPQGQVHSYVVDNEGSKRRQRDGQEDNMKRVNEGPGRTSLVVMEAAAISSVAAAVSLFTLDSGSLMSWTTKGQCDGMKGQNEQNTMQSGT